MRIPSTGRRRVRGGDLRANARLDGLRVLLVDDEQDARELFAATLEEHVAAVTAVGSAGEALSTLPVVRPHVLVSDIAMPGEDGHSLMRKVRALDRERGGVMASVALTAYGGPEHRSRRSRRLPCARREDRRRL